MPDRITSIFETVVKQPTNCAEIRDFIVFGCATWSIISVKSGRTLRYRTMKSPNGETIFVRVIQLNDHGEYVSKYIGYIGSNGNFRYGGVKATLPEKSTEVTSFVWFINYLKCNKLLPKELSFWGHDSISKEELDKRQVAKE